MPRPEISLSLLQIAERSTKMQEQVTKKRGPRAKKTETQEMGMEEKIPQT